MNKSDFISGKRLYLDKDGNVVGEKDPNKAKLLVNAGGTLSAEDAAKYGLVKDEEEAGVAEEEDETEEDTDVEASAKTTRKPKGKAKK